MEFWIVEGQQSSYSDAKRKMKRDFKNETMKIPLINPCIELHHPYKVMRIAAVLIIEF